MQEKVDFCFHNGYNFTNEIGQFVTILSVNKTREFDGRIMRSFFMGWVRCAHLFAGERV